MRLRKLKLNYFEVSNFLLIFSTETKSKIQNIRDLYRGINDFKKGYQPRCNIIKDENVDLVADSHGILARWRKYFSQLFNMHGVKDNFHFVTVQCYQCFSKYQLIAQFIYLIKHTLKYVRLIH